MSESNPVGRPTVMTPEVMAKLEEAFSIGATDREATFVAGISMEALYKYQRENPDYIQRKEALKDMLKYAARKNIVDQIQEKKSGFYSTWYLERKAKSEFAERTELTGPEGKDLPTPIYGGTSTKPIINPEI